MENVSDISSEEELAQLRDEGKITDAEYGQLLAAMQRTAEGKDKSAAAEEAKPKGGSKRLLGLAAFCMMLVGGALPVLGLSACLILGLPWVFILPAFLIGMAALATALVLGIISWCSGWGKATVICALAGAPVVLVVLVLLGMVSFCMPVEVPEGATRPYGAQNRIAAGLPDGTNRRYAVQNWIGSQLFEPIRKWKSAALSSSGENEYLQDTYLVIDTSKRTVRFVRWADQHERGCIRLADHCDWQFYRITPESRRLLKGEVRLKPAVVRGKRNMCKEVFVLMGSLDSDSGAWVEIRPGYVGSGSGLVVLDSFEFPDYKDEPGPDTIDESMLVSGDRDLTAIPGD
jgi:hypothetical protein